jgi:hypothetical protein
MLINKKQFAQIVFSIPPLLTLLTLPVNAEEDLILPHKIMVTIDNTNHITISENDRTKAVRSNQKLQWKIVPGTQLKEIEINFVPQKPNCQSSAGGTPCQNKLNSGSGVITCNLKSDLGPDPASNADQDFHDYCYIIRGYDKDRDEFHALDPIVRGRR